MDIYQTIVQNEEELLDEDLDFFEAELRTNGIYDNDYINKSLLVIKKIRDSRKVKKETVNLSKPETAYKEKSEIGIAQMPPEERNKLLFFDLLKQENITKMKEFLNNHPEINEELIEKEISMITQGGMTLLLKSMLFSELFLEKYYSALNKNALAQYQIFSEEFYVKHFEDLKPELVLIKGKNPWVKKENMSSKLNMFLRLRGIKL